MEDALVWYKTFRQTQVDLIPLTEYTLCISVHDSIYLHINYSILATLTINHTLIMVCYTSVRMANCFTLSCMLRAVRNERSGLTFIWPDMLRLSL
jgi:hypothetical protein